MFRPATTVVRQQTNSSLKNASRKNKQLLFNAQQKRSFGANHPPAEHPYFGQDSPIYTKFAYSQYTPNSTYGDKFAHPMNYQGHVPVTPKEFTVQDLEHNIPVHLPDNRVPNYPWLYILGCVAVSPFVTLISAQLTAEMLLETKPVQIKLLPWFLRPDTSQLILRSFVHLQGWKNYTHLDSLNGVKNVYQTEEFQNKLDKFIAKRSSM